ncbi:HAD-IA family hydrolase [Pelomonas sp. CA6]|uniref:HAD-IA family hydrolase n=1 Tax=Pelomonas sp. CA6 TaxID=2907999 RepID=UPI001F4BF4A8|nr:HAD-IA family hydrolase [Pelomonas sp. CA6]MCH7344186.1 HAD-IA family hydrolase [Pelomonas sp. CA6]
MKARSLLLLCAGGYQGLALIQGLQTLPGLRLIVADAWADNVTRHLADLYVVAPPLSEREAFEDFLLRLCREQGVELLMAATGHELETVERLRGELRALGVTVLVSSGRALRLGRDKLDFYRWLADEGHPALPFYEHPEAEGAPPWLIGKGRATWGGRELLRHRRGQDRVETPEAYVWQPLLQDFEEFSVDVAVRPDGAVSPLALRRRLRTVGGYAVVCEPGAPAEVEAAARAVVQGLAVEGACGPLNLQLLRWEGGVAVTDFNPRVGTSMALSVCAGLNPLEFLLAPPRPEAPPARPAAPLWRSTQLFRQQAVPRLALDGVRGVVLDLDDTLLDQKAWMLDKLRLCWAALADRLPPQPQFLADGWALIEEGQRADLFDRLCARHGWDAALRDALIEAYRAALPAQAVLYPEVLGVLEQLRRAGYRLALLTDNPAASQRQKLRVSGLPALLDAVLLTAELGCRKPEPAAFRAAADALALPPEALVMVGDNLHRDIHGALCAGYRHAFQLTRPGAFFNFDRRRWRELHPEHDAWTALDDLRGLHAHLPAATPDKETR